MIPVGLAPRFELATRYLEGEQIPVRARHTYICVNFGSVVLAPSEDPERDID